MTREATTSSNGDHVPPDQHTPDRDDAIVIVDRGETIVDGIPITWVTPARDSVVGIALWIPQFGSTAAAQLPILENLASTGWIAVSLDPLDHGRRANPEDATSDALLARTFAAFRDRMWQILGRTTLDAMRVLDWAQDQYGVLPIVAGGLSMGGDIAVALVGIDNRVLRVGAVGSTPDWKRPGMATLDGSGELVDQGEPTVSSAWFERALSPVRNLERFGLDPQIHFEMGQLDDHIPPDAALRFADVLSGGAARVSVRIVPGLDHRGVIRDRGSIERALKVMTEGESV